MIRGAQGAFGWAKPRWWSFLRDRCPCRTCGRTGSDPGCFRVSCCEVAGIQPAVAASCSYHWYPATKAESGRACSSGSVYRLAMVCGTCSGPSGYRKHKSRYLSDSRNAGMKHRLLESGQVRHRACHLLDKHNRALVQRARARGKRGFAQGAEKNARRPVSAEVARASQRGGPHVATVRPVTKIHASC